MRDFGVRFERVPLMCNNISAISVAKNPRGFVVQIALPL
jgi:hypothetical protein